MIKSKVSVEFVVAVYFFASYIATFIVGFSPSDAELCVSPVFLVDFIIFDKSIFKLMSVSVLGLINSVHPIKHRTRAKHKILKTLKTFLDISHHLKG